MLRSGQQSAELLADAVFNSSAKHRSHERQAALHCHIRRIYGDGPFHLLTHSCNAQDPGVTVPGFLKVLDAVGVLRSSVRDE